MSYYEYGGGGGGSGDHTPSAPASGTATPISTSAGSSSFLSSSFYNAFGGIMRRLSSDPAGNLQPHPGGAGFDSPDASYSDGARSFGHAATFSAPSSHRLSRPSNRLHTTASAAASYGSNNGIDGVYTPPPIARTASPLRPPPLEPLTLSGFSPDTPPSARLLTPFIAEEIRIMVPERLRIEEDWRLVYSLDQDGASLATLYEKTSKYDEHRIGFVLVVKDQEGGVFGAYLSEYPHPSAHYFGTGECFLWRASVLAPLPPPPSANTAHLATRSTTIAAAASPAQPASDATASAAPSTITTSTAASASSPSSSLHPERLIPGLVPPASPTASLVSEPRGSAAAPPQPPPSPSIRFSAFPYSGVNEYFIYCEPHSLSVGGGDGKYGLWLNDSLEKGISATCMTFGNQPLSDEGDKFGVLGVEVWVIGSRR